jgi:hypothetical protein
VRWLLSSSLAFLLSWLLAAVASAANFSDDFERADGPVDVDVDDSWLTYQGVADIRSGEMVLETAGAEGWTWIDGEDSLFEGDIAITFDIRFDPSDNTPEVGRHGGLMFFTTEKTWRYSPTMSGYTIDWIDRTDDHGFRFHKWENGVEQILTPDLFASDLPDPPETWRITISGPTITLEADGEEIISLDDESFRSGYVGFWGWSNGQHIHVDNLSVGEPCDAVIAASAESGPAPLSVEFDGSGSTSPAGPITGFRWSFGDGDSAEGPKVSHTYQQPGRYQVRLTASDGAGNLCSKKASIAALWTGDVAPWTSIDVGAPVMPGGARFDGSCLSILGGGLQIALREDSFHFVHRQQTGDGSLTFQVKELLRWEANARAGVMLRDGSDADAVFAFIGVQNLNGQTRVIFVSRRSKATSATARLTSDTSASVVLEPPQAWLRLERQGLDLIGASSPDGSVWTEFRRVALTAPPDTLLAGLAVVGADTAGDGRYAHVVLCPQSTAPELCSGGQDEDQDGKTDCDDPDCAADAACTETGPKFRRSDANADGATNIADGSFVLNFLFLGGPDPKCIDAADANDDGGVNIADGSFILNFLFIGGREPPMPFADCGEDPTEDELECGEFPSC